MVTPLPFQKALTPSSRKTLLASFMILGRLRTVPSDHIPWTYSNTKSNNTWSIMKIMKLHKNRVNMQLSISVRLHALTKLKFRKPTHWCTTKTGLLNINSKSTIDEWGGHYEFSSVTEGRHQFPERHNSHREQIIWVNNVILSTNKNEGTNSAVLHPHIAGNYGKWLLKGWQGNRVQKTDD